MASISKLQTAKDGRRFWKIQVSRGRGLSPYSTRFYWPEKKNGDPVSENKALGELGTFAAEFELKCKAGEVLSRKEAAEQKADEDRQRSELKTVKQYAEGVYMARKKLTLAESSRRGYQDVLDNHIYPAIGDKLITDITPAMLNKLLLDCFLTVSCFLMLPCSMWSKGPQHRHFPRFFAFNCSMLSDAVSIRFFCSGLDFV